MHATTVLHPLFAPGTLVATPGVMAAVHDDYLTACLLRHLTGDWGCVCPEDQALNDAAVRDGARILSAYPLDPAQPCAGFGGNTLWILTEADRGVTTFLLPEEY